MIHSEKTIYGVVYENDELNIERRVFSLNCFFYANPQEAIMSWPKEDDVNVLVLGIDRPYGQKKSTFYWIINLTNNHISAVHADRLTITWKGVKTHKP